MIAWLGEYLQQLVIVILVATCLDLMLPNSSMERYVKLVMGLLIIMVILSPVLKFFHQGVAWNFDNSLGESEDKKSMATMQQIQENANSIDKAKDEFILKQTEEKIAQNTKELLKKKFSVEVVEAEARMQDKGGKLQLQELNISLTAKASIDVKPIKPVQIDIGDNAQQGELVTKLTSFLQEYWGLKSGQVRVRMF